MWIKGLFTIQPEYHDERIQGMRLRLMIFVYNPTSTQRRGAKAFAF